MGRKLNFGSHGRKQAQNNISGALIHTNIAHGPYRMQGVIVDNKNNFLTPMVVE